MHHEFVTFLSKNTLLKILSWKGLMEEGGEVEEDSKRIKTMGAYTVSVRRRDGNFSHLTNSISV
jgi:hypothetical protein